MTIQDTVVEILAEKALLKPGDVKLDFSISDLGLDSLGIVEIIFALEEQFDIEIDIKRLYKGEENILWPGKIKWFASSSGTSSGKSKLIPISKDSLIECHYKGGKDLLALYYTSNPKTQLSQFYSGCYFRVIYIHSIYAIKGSLS